MGSPAEGLEVEPVLGEAGGEQGGADQGGPGLGAADVDVALGDVGHPAQEGGQVVDALADAAAEPGAVDGAARAGRAPAGRARASSTSSSRTNSGSVGAALQQDASPGA